MCQHYCKTCNKNNNKNTKYYLNKKLEKENNSYKCSACKEIKRVEEFSFVDIKKSKRRRKVCSVCRCKQMRDRYYKRKKEKLALEQDSKTTI